MIDWAGVGLGLWALAKSSLYRRFAMEAAARARTVALSLFSCSRRVDTSGSAKLAGVINRIMMIETAMWIDLMGVNSTEFSGRSFVESGMALFALAVNYTC